MIISGYFFSSAMNRPVMQALKEKFLRLGLPILSWSIIYYLILGLKPMEQVNEFWFIKCLLVLDVAFILTKGLIKSSYATMLALPVAFILLTPYTAIWNVAYVCPFFATGLFLRESNRLGKMVSSRYAGWFIAMAAVLYVLLFFVWDYSMSVDVSQWIVCRQSPHWRFDFIAFLVRYAIGIDAFLTLYLILKMCESRLSWLTRPINSLGQQTIGIYIIHSIYMASLIMYVASHFDINRSVRVAMVTLLSIALSYIISLAISKVRYLSICLLGTRYKGLSLSAKKTYLWKGQRYKIFRK